ncbi:hypothetical protein BDZ91DRAFT_200697 [Kalaharituber pfeilii]|nr:hypothetical protein BDZ91DRAFT_200697 [Kalaharituber pfeilii]
MLNVCFEPTHATPFPSHNLESPVEVSYNSEMKLRARHAKISVMKCTIEKLLELSASELLLYMMNAELKWKSFKKSRIK